MTRIPSIAIIGGGPRGVSLLERIGANLAALGGGPVEIHIVDDTQVGAGRIWRTDQTRELCMNTLAHAVTLFTDDSATIDGPVRPGPTLYEWCQLALHQAFGSAGAAVAAIPPEHVAAFAEVPVRPGFADDYRAELEEQRHESHPSRSLYGEYIRWCYQHAVASLPASVTLVEHLARVTSVDTADGRQLLTLRVPDPAQRSTADDGHPEDAERSPLKHPPAGRDHSAGDTAAESRVEELRVDAVVAATGWLERRRTADEIMLEAAQAEHPDLVWVRPDSPVDQPLDAVPDGEPAIVRGLGMGFFDAMALLTIGRGGRFVDDPDAACGLRYEASGREPVLHVTSTRGVPFRAKTQYGSLPPAPRQRFFGSVDWDAEPRPIDFDTRAWPLILADAFADHAEYLDRVKPGAADLEGVLDHLGEALTAIADAGVGGDTREVVQRLAAAVAPHIADPADRLDLAEEMFPGAGRRWSSPEAFDAWVYDFVAGDLAASADGHDSPLKAALWAIGAARGRASKIGTYGGFDAESRGSRFRTLFSVGGMVGSGPPAFRNQQLLALADAGLAHFIGPHARLSVADGVFWATSDAVADSTVRARVLIDAWMHFHDVADSADPLVRSLTDAGRVRPFSVPARTGSGGTPTGGFDIDPATGRLVHADGALDPAFHMSGIPVDQTLHDTIISPMPRTNPTMLRETDRVARSVIAVALGAGTLLAPSM